MQAEHIQNAPTPKKAVKLTVKPSDQSDTCRICNVYFKIAVGDFGKKNRCISTENLFKISKRAGVTTIPLADLLKTHLGVEVDPQDGKSSRVCAKCALKIRNATTLCEFIRTALTCNDNSACDESDDQQRFKRFNVVSPQRSIKKSRPYSSPSTSKQSKETKEVISQEKCSQPPAKRPLIFSHSEPVPITVSSRAETNFPLDILLEDASGDENGKAAKQLNVDVTLYYPSGKKNMQVPDSVTNIVKNFAIGNFRAAVHLIFKCHELKSFVHEAVKTTISAELKEYCHSDNSLLKHTSPAELAAFSNKLVCHEVSVICPLWNSAIRAAAGCDKAKNPEQAVNVLALCSAALAKFRNERMSAHAYRTSVILLHSGAKSQDFTRLNRLGICMSHGATIAKQKEMSKQHDSLVLTWKKDIEAAKKCELLLKEVQDKQIPAPVLTSDNSMEIDEYDLSQTVLEGYDNFSLEAYEKSKELLGSSSATPAALDVAIVSASETFITLPRYRWVTVLYYSIN